MILSFTPDGKLAAAERRGVVDLVDAAAGKLVRRFETVGGKRRQLVTAAAFSRVDQRCQNEWHCRPVGFRVPRVAVASARDARPGE